MTFADRFGGAIDASAEKEQQEKREQYNAQLRREPYREKFKVKLNRDEERELGLESAKLTKQIEQIEKQLAGEKQTATSKIKLAQQRISEISEALDKGAEERELEVYERFFFQNGTVDILRADTNEKIGERAMKTDERQKTIFDGAKTDDPEPEETTEAKNDVDPNDGEEDETTIDDPDRILAGAKDDEPATPRRKKKKAGGKKGRRG